MAKFRPKNAQLDLVKDRFSIGSIVDAGSDGRYLVVGQASGNSVMLLNLKTFRLSKGSKVVDDPHWLAIEEAGDVAYLTELSLTRSDFHYDDDGLKE